MNAKKLKAEGYFQDLAQGTKNLIIELCKETMKDAPEGYLPGENSDGLSEIECKQRSGFIPFDSNRGGITIRQYIDLMGMWGGGYSVAHKKAQDEIERQIEYGLKCAKERFFEHNEEKLKDLGIVSFENISYHELIDIGQRDLAEEFSEYENENLSGDDSNIQFEVRFMYHGKTDGLHKASVSCAVNTEGPYHRSSIPWAPGVFCEGAKEIEITWNTQKELKVKLQKTLVKCSKEIF
jgi:hypothetical protein